MNWESLINGKRLRRTIEEHDDGRSPFQKDIDRIVFSAAFRRLANKTQVHPLAENDHIHNRLTHSVETASVGRSLGTIVGTSLRSELESHEISRDDFGYVVQAACLAHDIGNPPFGHAGEQAIGSWFKEKFDSRFIPDNQLTKQQKTDLEQFEGNAQGFRILTQHENHKWDGGLQLTFATLGTFTKYPRPSVCKDADDDSYVGAKKFGFFSAEKEYFKEVAEILDLPPRTIGGDYWTRHPLAFLVEAADDICYNIVDVEDAYTLGDLQFSTAEKLLGPLAREISYGEDMEEREKVAYLRALAIGGTVKELASVFIKNKIQLMNGEFSNSLISASNVESEFREIEKVAKTRIYTTRTKTILELAGHKIIHGLLDEFIKVVFDLREHNWDVEKVSAHTDKLIRYTEANFSRVDSLYDGLLYITDYVSGMTDRFALDTYRKLYGISL